MPTRVLSDFDGLWQLRREISHADGTLAGFEGQARWKPDGGGRLYVEKGRLLLPGGQAIHAERRYRWGADMAVFFGDGRFFHHVPPAGGAVTHDCPPDIYDGMYDFSQWPAFSVTWQVKGPRKDYRSVTRYFR